jgi:uncharacterized membrane protein YqjE
MAVTPVSSNTNSLRDQLQSARDEALWMRGEAWQLSADMQHLLKMEMDLARAEMQEAKTHATMVTVFGGAAAMLGLVTSILVFLTVMFALDTVLPLWAAALITAGIAALITVVCALLARQRLSRLSPVPRRTIKTMQEDLQWIRSQIRSSAI